MEPAVRQALERTLATLEGAAAEIRAQLAGEEVSPAGEGRSEAFLLDKNWIAPSEAAFMCRCTEETIRRWCDAHGIGERRGGRWFVSRARLQEFLAR